MTRSGSAPDRPGERPLAGMEPVEAVGGERERWRDLALRRWRTRRGETLLLLAGGLVVVGSVVFSFATDKAAAGLTLLGAVIAAGIAAWTAKLRLDRQLEAAALRHQQELENAAALQLQQLESAAALQQQQLDDAARRHDRQLQADRGAREADRTHDRDLAALNDLRAVLDEAVREVTVLLDTAHQIAKPSVISAFRSTGSKPLRSPSHELEDHARALGALGSRLDLRLGSFNEVTESLQGVIEATGRLVALRRSTTGRLSAETLRMAIDDIGHAYADFLARAVRAADAIAARLDVSGAQTR